MFYIYLINDTAPGFYALTTVTFVFLINVKLLSTFGETGRELIIAGYKTSLDDVGWMLKRVSDELSYSF